MQSNKQCALDHGSTGSHGIETGFRLFVALAACCLIAVRSSRADSPRFDFNPSATEWRQQLEQSWLVEERFRADTNLITNVTTRDDARGGCDGIKDGQFGFHTENAKAPWWQVDLGESRSLARVVIWNRADNDGAAKRAARIMVQLSDDGKSWRTVYQHGGTVFFGHTDRQPLEVNLANERSRFVRVQLPGSEFLHLDEVEVFGPSDTAKNLALNCPADQVSTSKWSRDHRPVPPPNYAMRTGEVLANCERLLKELTEGDATVGFGHNGQMYPIFPILTNRTAGRVRPGEPPHNVFHKAGSPARTRPTSSKGPRGEQTVGGEGQRGARADDWERIFREIQVLKSRLSALPAGAEAKPLFLEARALQRELALRHPLLDFDTILFTKRIPPSFNHMSDQYYGWWSKPGGGIYLLRGITGDRPATECLTTASFQKPGSFLRPTLSYDGTKVLFAWCRYYPKLADEQDKLNKANVSEDAFYHLFEMNLDGSGLRRLTHGKYDDFDGRYLPDGRIVFLSTRRGHALQVGCDTAAQTLLRDDLPDCYVRCGGGPERPVAVYTLHTIDADGSGLSAISPFEMFEWTPEVGHDGSILYSRWDYIDRDNMPYMGLWSISPDGLNARIVYGNYTKAPHCAFEPKPIPGSRKIIFTASGHHQQTMGSLVLLDPSAGTEGSAPITRLTPEVPFPEIEGWPKTYYAGPWPLSERYHLVAWGHEGATVPGPEGWNRWHAVQRPDNGMALYYFDAAVGRELLYADPAIACGDPIPVRARTRPPVVASVANQDGPNEGRFLLADVYCGLRTVSRGEIKSLRLVAVPPKTHPTMNFPNLGLTADDPGKLMLGTVPVEEDGSAYFRAPAGVIMFFQALDAEGKAVQTMRSVTHVQPGQTLSCIGCHENRYQAPAPRPTLAVQREPSRITAGPEGSWPLRFDHLVQPVLDRQCVRCHSENSADERAAKFDLTAAKSYDSLTRYGKPSLRDVVMAGYRRGFSVEGEGPARGGVLLALFAPGTNHYDTKLTGDDRERLITWMDTYAQKAGAFDAAQEEQLENLRRACIGLLMERPPKQTTAARNEQGRSF